MSRMSENMEASTSRNRKILQGLYRDNFTLYVYVYMYMYLEEMQYFCGAYSEISTLPLVEEDTSYTNTRSWNEQKCSYGSRRGPTPRTTVLARPSSNLLDLDREVYKGLTELGIISTSYYLKNTGLHTTQ
jgi:hypothetical protein